jgi:hypothetical protein
MDQLFLSQTIRGLSHGTLVEMHDRMPVRGLVARSYERVER